MCWCTYSEKQGANTTHIHNPIKHNQLQINPDTQLNNLYFLPSYPPQLLKGVLLICYPTWQNHTNYCKQISCMDPKPWVIEVAHIHSSYLRIWVMALPYYLYILPNAFSQNRPTKLIPFIQSAKDLSNCCFQGLHQPFYLSFEDYTNNNEMITKDRLGRGFLQEAGGWFDRLGRSQPRCLRWDQLRGFRDFKGFVSAKSKWSWGRHQRSKESSLAIFQEPVFVCACVFPKVRIQVMTFSYLCC